MLAEILAFPDPRHGGAVAERPIAAIIVSEVRFVADAWAGALDDDPVVRVKACCASVESAVAAAADLEPDLILLDTAIVGGTAAARRLSEASAARIIAAPVPDDEATILAWVDAGVSGYVANSATLAQWPSLLRTILQGRQVCSLRIASALLGRPRTRPDAPPTTVTEGPDSLTRRELEIWRLLAAGQTNKEIARRLDIGVGTAKCHVHNVLGKLGLTSRAQVAARSHRLSREPMMLP